MESPQENCIFCKIAFGESSANKVYEDVNTVAFLDIRPVNEGHTLVVPKAHFGSHEETPDDVLANLFQMAKKIGVALKKSLGADGFNIIVNSGAVAGQIIDHTHVHVIPRFNTDGLANWPGTSYEEGEAEKVAEKIRAAL